MSAAYSIASMNYNKSARVSSRRITIGLLTQGAIDPNNRSVWSGAVAAANDLDINLVCFPGRTLHSPIDFEAQCNIIYDLVDSQNVDGLVVWLAGLNMWIEPKITRAFLDQFSDFPVVTAGIIVEDIPGVVVDNYRGMCDVVSHMIEVHGRTRIAFIRGPRQHQEAIDRYRAYVDTLARYRVSLHDELVVMGNFKEGGGKTAVEELMDQRKVKFDALIAASDNMAIGAMKSLQSRGVRVPDEIVIAGLNDEPQGQVITPPLTTSPLHFYEQLYQTTHMVLDKLHGKDVPPKVVLPARLMVRQSCGCPDPLVEHAKNAPHLDRFKSYTEEIRQLNTLLFGDTDSSVLLPQDEVVCQAFPCLLKAFLAEARGDIEEDFIGSFVESLQLTARIPDVFTRWHEIISLMRFFALSQLVDAPSRLRVESLTQQARIVIGETARRWHAFHELLLDEKLHILEEINQSLSATTDLGELTDVLSTALYLLNIAHGFLSLYVDAQEPTQKAQLIFAYSQHKRNELAPGGEIFPSQQLIPEEYLNNDLSQSLVVQPLYFREDQLGFAVFEADPQEEAIYEILAGQISAALRRIFLTERNVRLFNEAVQARNEAEEANLLKSRFLSMVSHELRTPLSLIVGTIEMMLREEQSGHNPHFPDIYRKDMDSIQAGAQHLYRLIGDVLDLASNQAGELHLVSEPLDISNLLNDAVILGKTMAREKGLLWNDNIPDDLPLIWGDRTRLRQVTLNLVSNAVKFTEQGEVSLHVDVEENEIVVKINDSGIGIPEDEQSAIFDEFRRSERSVQRGYGGMGLGLAISRRLIELHGGHIQVISSGIEGSGSTFYFSLPILQEDVKLNGNRYIGRRNTVLLLSENEAGSQLIADHLARKGFEVDVIGVDDNPQWFSQIVASPPGAVVLDYQPATEKGWELIRLLKQNANTLETPVIFYSLSSEQTLGDILEMDYLTKPISSNELTKALERIGLQANNDHKRVLIVDDDPNILDMHVRMLDGQFDSVQIYRASNGLDALEILKKNGVDLILLDLMMPEMDGFEVLEELRNNPLMRSVPVIVLTAQILTAQDMARLQQGVATVLRKGLFETEEVLSHIEKALSHHKYLGTEAARITRQAMGYIHERYQEKITRRQLANVLSVNERHLTRCFQQELGVSPISYLNRYRITQAKQILDQGNANITRVAFSVGFSSSNYFGRVFRDEVGLTPSEYCNQRN